MAANDSRQSRATQKLQPEELDELRRRSAGIEDAVREWMDRGDPQDPEPPRRARTETIQDPLTAALLAEVARTSRTVEIDPETVAEAGGAAISQDAPPAKRGQGS